MCLSSFSKNKRGTSAGRHRCYAMRSIRPVTDSHTMCTPNTMVVLLEPLPQPLLVRRVRPMARLPYVCADVEAQMATSSRMLRLSACFSQRSRFQLFSFEPRVVIAVSLGWCEPFEARGGRTLVHNMRRPLPLLALHSLTPHSLLLLCLPLQRELVLFWLALFPLAQLDASFFPLATLFTSFSV